MSFVREINFHMLLKKTPEKCRRLTEDLVDTLCRPIAPQTENETARRIDFFCSKREKRMERNGARHNRYGALCLRDALFAPSKKDETCINEVLSLLSPERLKKRSVFSLSGGEYRRVRLARSLASKLLLLDESLSNLDMAYQKEFMDILLYLSHKKTMSVCRRKPL